MPIRDPSIEEEALQERAYTKLYKKAAKVAKKLETKPLHRRVRRFTTLVPEMYKIRGEAPEGTVGEAHVGRMEPVSKLGQRGRYRKDPSLAGRRVIYKKELQSLAEHGIFPKKTVVYAHPVQTISPEFLLGTWKYVGRETTKAQRYTKLLKRLKGKGKVLGLGAITLGALSTDK